MKNPSFDNWTMLFTVFALLGFLVGSAVLFIKRQHLSKRIYLTAILYLFSITLLNYVLYWTGYIIYYPYLLGFVQLFYFLYGPLLLLYVQKLESPKLLPQTALHFLPFIIFFIISIPILLQSNEAKRQIIIQGFSNPSFYIKVFQLIPWLSILHLFIYSFLIFSRRKIFEEFSIIKRWVASLSLSLLGVAISYLLYEVLAELHLIRIEWDYMISFAMSMFILTITILGFIQPSVFNDRLESLRFISGSKIVEKYKNSPLDEKLSKKIADSIHQTMIQNKIWRDSSLRLEKLASILKLPKHYLSQVINEQFNKNFFEFVNYYRIKEAKEIMSEVNDSIKVIDIVYQVGFSNKVSFNKAFKYFTKMTPTEYLANVRKIGNHVEERKSS
ncbi:MAG: AraC family transcriptional regulator [Ignavibacteriaceae bacterium]|nr:AraC family transcriptional regulator [Ignavibacteriaceae bacterium]